MPNLETGEIAVTFRAKFFKSEDRMIRIRAISDYGVAAEEGVVSLEDVVRKIIEESLIDGLKDIPISISFEE